MKVRKGFVSNSSSSSFIVAFPKGFEVTPENVKNTLFGDAEKIYEYDYSVVADDAASHIASNMLSQTPNDLKAIEEALNGHLSGSPSFESFRTKKFDPVANRFNYEYDWEAYEAATREHRKKTLDKIMKEFTTDKYDVYCFEFSDDTSFGCVLEHGPTFSNLSHVRISNH